MSKAARTRAEIIRKTAPVFNRLGYAGTSLTQMTQATGLTKGSIYGNFSGKDEVALEVFDYNWQQVQRVTSPESLEGKSCREQLEIYVGVFDHLFEDLPPGGCPLLNSAVEADDTHPELRERVRVAFYNWRDKLAGIIKKGKSLGEFAQDIDEEAAALKLIALIEGGIMIVKLTGNRKLQECLAGSIADEIGSLCI